jgi:hypothetical protein
MRVKLKAEIQALKPEDTLEYWDKVDPTRRITYRHGDPPEVVDLRRAQATGTPESTPSE